MTEQVKLSRRWFLGGALAVTGAVVLADVGIGLSAIPRIVGDGIHDDTAGIQAALDGKPFECEGCVVRAGDGVLFSGGHHRVTGTIRMHSNNSMVGTRIDADHAKVIITAETHNAFYSCYFNRLPAHIGSGEPVLSFVANHTLA